MADGIKRQQIVPLPVPVTSMLGNYTWCRLFISHDPAQTGLAINRFRKLEEQV